MKAITCYLFTFILVVMASCADQEVLPRTTNISYYVQATVKPPANSVCRLLRNGIVEQEHVFESRSVFNSVNASLSDSLAIQVDDTLDGYQFNITLNYNHCCGYDNNSEDEDVKVYSVVKSPGNNILLSFKALP